MAKGTLVDTRILHEERPFVLESGEILDPIDIAYETYGELSKDRDNVILIEHALSGDAHAAFYHKGERKPGWWDNMIGPGKAFDTEKYFIICSNVLGGCKGTTGPSSINPATGRPYGLSFPFVSIRDMTDAQCLLLSHLGIEKVLCVAGGSMGGMQALQFVCDYPEKTMSFICIASALKHSAQQIAFNEVGRRAIMADPRWNNGNYYGEIPPEGGLSIARMIGHITYLSEKMMQKRFGRERKMIDKKNIFRPSFEVEHYLDYQGVAFVRRFDANSYLYITSAMDDFDLVASLGSSLRSRGEDRALGTSIKEMNHIKGLVITFSSDWLYPPSQGKDITRFFRSLNADVSYAEVDSDHGHDSFLTDVKTQSELVEGFLKPLMT